MQLEACSLTGGGVDAGRDVPNWAWGACSY